MKFALLGMGSFGTTMGVLLARNLIKNESYRGYKLFCYVRDESRIDNLVKYRINDKYEKLQKVKYPDNVIFSTSIKEVIENADYIVFAYPSKYAYDILIKIKPFICKRVKVISLVKGFYFEGDDFYRISTLISDVLDIKPDNICSLGGPNTYGEIAENLFYINPKYKPCNFVVSSTSTDTAKIFRDFYFYKDCIRAYTSEDIVSAEVCGALKNIIALACGMADGFMGEKDGLGINFKASLITRGMYEIAYFSRGIGGSFEKAFGISGIGDVIATSFKGRSYYVGKDLAKGISIDEVKSLYPNYEIEAFQTLDVFHKYIEYLKINNPDISINMPVIHAIYDIVRKNSDVKKTIQSVINGDLKSEFRMDPYIMKKKKISIIGPQ